MRDLLGFERQVAVRLVWVVAAAELRKRGHPGAREAALNALKPIPPTRWKSGHRVYTVS